ncbi:serine hydrolase domain-containing protein [Streptomyces coeruleoprunus]
MPLVLVLCGLVVRTPALPSPRPSSPALDRLVSAGGAPGAALLAEAPGAVRFQTAGHGMGRADRFRAGSITKTFVATVVLQLAAERRLALGDTVAARLPGLLPEPVARRITVRQLLTHTSGLPDYVPPTGPPTPEAAVRAALAARPARPPGRYAYANTNYVLLGLLVTRVTGRPYAAEADRRILTPLRLTGTSFPGSRTTLPSPHGRGYDAGGRDVTVLDPRIAGAAGELVSTLDDLNRFYAALLGGRLLTPPQLRELLATTAAGGRYGMALYPVALSCGATVWGHNGRIPGSYVRTAATRDGRHVVTFRTNTDALADVPGTPLETALLEAEFCPGPPGTAAS